MSAVGSGRGRARVSQSCDPVDHDREDHAVDFSQRFVALGLGGSSIPAMRCVIRAVRSPMSLVKISAGPENVADGYGCSTPRTESETQPVRCTSLALMIRFDEITEAFTEMIELSSMSKPHGFRALR